MYVENNTMNSHKVSCIIKSFRRNQFYVIVVKLVFVFGVKR